MVAGIVVLSLGLFAGIIGSSVDSGGHSQTFTSASPASNNQGYNAQAQYTYSNYQYLPKFRYIDPAYDEPLHYLGANNSETSSNTGFSIDISSTSQDDWTQFYNLVQSDGEFSTYAEQLLDSQCWNLIRQRFVPNGESYSMDVQSVLLANQLYKLKERINFGNKSSLPNSPILADFVQLYTEKERILTYIIPLLFNTSLQNFNSRYTLMLDANIDNGYFLNNYTQQDWELFDLKNVLSSLVRGSLDFWKWKNNRRFANWTGKRPFILNNGNNRCWLQAGVQLLAASTTTDDYSQLGNWGKFLKFLSNYQSENRAEILANGIDFIKQLTSFCYSDQFDQSGRDMQKISDTLVWLRSPEREKGSTEWNAVKKLFEIFPELKIKKFDSQECIIRSFSDPIFATDGIEYNKISGSKTPIHMPAPIAVRHLIPGLPPVNDGIGKDPEGSIVQNRYGEYRLEYDIRGRLLVYELRGMTLTELLATTRVVNINCENKTMYYSKPSIHARAVIKLDDSSLWHYCDSNGVYFCEDNLKNIFLNNRSIMSWYEDYQNLPTKPANHSCLQLYSLVSQNDWDRKV